MLLLTTPDGGALVRVIAGDVAGHRGPGSTHTPISLVHATVEPGAELVLPWPREFNALVYVLGGRGSVGPEGRPIHTGQLAVHGPGEAIVVRADAEQESRHPALDVLILGGQPIGEPVYAHGPFVMNTRDEIIQAFEDFEAGQPRHRARRPHRQRLIPLAGLRPAGAWLGAGHDRGMQRIPGSEATNSATWSAADVGDLTGRVALVTGANSGIGYETTRVLADHGAHVIMACRDREKAARARDKLESQLDRSSLELLDLDLSDLASVRAAAERVVDQHARLDLLVNNAGVMGTPYRQTADGFELQMATNHLGHFALTGLLLDRLVTTERSRIVTVSSHMHRLGRLRPDDVATTKARNPWIDLQHDEAGQPPLRGRVEPAPRGRRLPHDGAGGAPRLDAQQPRRQRRRLERAAACAGD